LNRDQCRGDIRVDAEPFAVVAEGVVEAAPRFIATPCCCNAWRMASSVPAQAMRIGPRIRR